MPPTMHTSTTSTFDPEPVNNNMSNMRDESSTKSILTTMNTFVKAVNEMEDTILIPSRLLDMAPESKEDPKAIVPIESGNGQNNDLFAFYQMLNAIKQELVQGPTDEGDPDAPGHDDQSSKVAKAFRHHLQGLFGVLKQLTGSANFITSRYQEEIGELASGSGATSSLSSFTL